MEKNWLYDFFDFDAKNGFNRVAYTDEDVRYKCLMIKKMQELGMNVTYDNIGNICGSLQQGIIDNPNKKVIALHSHTDSVPNGGQFDGAAGLVASLLAVEQMQKSGTLPDAVFKVIINACEESSRFNLACLGSKYLRGEVPNEAFKKIRDKQGTTLGDAVKSSESSMHKYLNELGCRPIEKADYVVAREDIDHAIEGHIEQHDSLHKKGKDIGIVRSIAAPYRFGLKIRGEQFHTGSMPMDERADAVEAGARFVVSLNDMAREKNSNFRATTVQSDTPKWVMNTGTPDVLQTVDIRMFNPWTPSLMEELVEELIHKTERATGVKIDKSVISSAAPKSTEGPVYDALLGAAKGEGFDVEEKVLSGASHDTQYYDSDAGLFFMPNTGGSHRPTETMKKRSLFDAALVIKGASQKLGATKKAEKAK